MTPAEKQQNLIARFAVIDDPHERLAALVSFKPALDPLPGEERVGANLVRGCMSLVWLAGSLEHGRCRFRFHADSPMVRGLAGVLCAIYDGAQPEEIDAVEPEIFEKLGISKNLTPTRLNGIAMVRARIRELARSLSVLRE